MINAAVTFPAQQASNKVRAIKAVRNASPNMCLRDAKLLVESAAMATLADDTYVAAEILSLINDKSKWRDQ